MQNSTQRLSIIRPSTWCRLRKARSLAVIIPIIIMGLVVRQFPQESGANPDPIEDPGTTGSGSGSATQPALPPPVPAVVPQCVNGVPTCPPQVAVVTDDNDGDGIKNSDDDCPDEAEDFDTLKDEDGCPDSIEEDVAELARLRVIHGKFLREHGSRLTSLEGRMKSVEKNMKLEVKVVPPAQTATTKPQTNVIDAEINILDGKVVTREQMQAAMMGDKLR